jgi:hypothetical protein
MAVVSVTELATNQSSGKWGESLQLTRTFMIRTDKPFTPHGQIVAAVGAQWGNPHPYNTDCKLLEFTLAPADDVGLRWKYVCSYSVPPRGRKLKENAEPEDFWEATGGVSTVPAFTDTSGDTITNSAKDPLEGLSRERAEMTWTLVKFYKTAAWEADARAYSNTVNSSSWAGGAAQTWKCDFQGAKLREIQAIEDDPGTEVSEEKITQLVETRWEFRYEPDTWKLKPWDVGFMEIGSDGKRKAILGSDGKPVKQPVALTSSGAAASAGTAPSVIRNGDGAEVYKTNDFSATFGTPKIV